MIHLKNLQLWMEDPAITDICINPDGKVYLDRGNGLESCYSPEEILQDDTMSIKTWVLEQLSKNGKSWDARNPFVDATIPPAHRLHVVFPPVGGNGLLISLRRLGRTLREPPSKRWQTSGELFARLQQATLSGQSILIAGSTGSGKTTLLNDLLSSIPQNERIIALEDTPELSPSHPHFVSLQSRPSNADGFGEITIKSLLRQALRMRPDRILLGECRGAEALELLQILNTGHQGSLATIHANTARDALRRLEILALLSAPESLSLMALREWIATGVNWVAHVKRDSSGNRKICELAQVQGMESGTILLRPFHASLFV